MSCDESDATGCEIDLMNDPANCGACGTACDAGHLCAFGHCDPPVLVRPGWRSSCLIRTSGQVDCWGDNAVGQIGDGTFHNRHHPVHVTMGGAPLLATDVFSAERHACAIGVDHKAYCWGRGQYGELGDGVGVLSTEPTEVTVASGETSFGDVVQLETGISHTCLRDADGVWCWGRTTFGAIGSFPAVPGGIVGAYATPVVLPSAATELSVGNSFGCAVVESGHVYCWGRNHQGQLGIDSADGGNHETPVRAGTLENIIDLEAGAEHVCARNAANDVWCWGNAANLTSSNSPESIPALAGATWLDSTQSMCAGLPAGSHCLGANTRGQLGNGTTTNASAPVQPMGVTTERLWTGSNATCTIIDGVAMCFGDDQRGQLGHSENIVLRTPTMIPALQNASKIAIGAVSGCVVVDLEIFCFGSAATATLGRFRNFASTIPLKVGSLLSPSSLDVGYFGGCATTSNTVRDDAWCWGLNWSNRFGTTGATTPLQSSSATEEQQTALGSSHMCVLDSGAVYCAGRNTELQLGPNATTNPSSDFVRVPGLTAVVQITEMNRNGSVVFRFSVRLLRPRGDEPYDWDGYFLGYKPRPPTRR